MICVMGVCSFTMETSVKLLAASIWDECWMVVAVTCPESEIWNSLGRTNIVNISLEALWIASINSGKSLCESFVGDSQYVWKQRNRTTFISSLQIAVTPMCGIDDTLRDSELPELRPR